MGDDVRDRIRLEVSASGSLTKTLTIPALRQTIATCKVESGKESGFESHYKVLAVGVLLGLVNLHWDEDESVWIVHGNLSAVPAGVDQFLLRGEYDIGKIFSSFPLTLVRAWIGEDHVVIESTTGGFNELAKKLRTCIESRKADNTRETDGDREAKRSRPDSDPLS
jgi:hypothetical protein